MANSTPKIQLGPDGKPFIDNETNRQMISEKDMLNKPSSTTATKQNILKNEDESPSQKKVNLLNKIRDILKNGGMDSQQNYKALIELDNLLFNGDDELDYNGKPPVVIPETGNEPAGSPNPNIKVPTVEVDKK